MRLIFMQVFEFYYFTCGPYQEGVATLQAAERRLATEVPGREAQYVQAHVLTGLGHFAVRRGDLQAGRHYFTTSAAIMAEQGRGPEPGDASDPLIGLGVIALVEGDYAAAERYGIAVRERNTSRELAANLAYGWYLQAEAAQAQGLLRAAEEAAVQALAAAQRAGAEWLGAYIHNQLGQLALSRASYGTAARHFGRSYAIRAAFGDDQGMALALLSQGALAAQQGQPAVAADYYARSLTHYQQIGDRGGVAQAQLGLGAASLVQGDPQGARQQIERALRLAHELAFHHVALAGLSYLAELLLVEGETEVAVVLLGHVLTNPASRPETSARAGALLAHCNEQLEPGLYAAAVARGRGIKLETLLLPYL
ncbi:MAG: tetratricopeptide repeat protein [Oscillochloridaceae bacterium umkhey_bin13]